MKKIDLNDKHGWKGQFIILFILFFYLYLVIKFWENISIKTNLCESCGGILRIINEPIPPIVFTVLLVITINLFFKCFKSEGLNNLLKGLFSHKITLDNGDVFEGTIKRKERVPHGKGTYTTSDGKVIKGIWKNGKLVKTISVTESKVK